MEKVEFTSEDQHVVGVLHYARHGKARRKSIVITCHGLMSSKDSKKYLQIADLLSSRGLAVLRFDFRGSGESEGSGNLLSKRIADLEAAKEFVHIRGYQSVGLIGSSYGGATAILVASETSEIKCIVTWSTPCKLIELFDDLGKQDVKGQPRSPQQFEKSDQSRFKEDLSKYDVAEAARRITKILVIHCREDRVVPWNQARMIYDNAREPKRLKIFEGGDHQLIDPYIRDEALSMTVDWLMRYL
jgi:alpha-beta hydrolase superfamily lysophospholipase